MEHTAQAKWMYSLWGALVFFVIASPWTFKQVDKVTERLLGLRAVEKNGKPTGYGLALHTLVFLLVVRVMMEFKYE